MFINHCFSPPGWIPSQGKSAGLLITGCIVQLRGLLQDVVSALMKSKETTQEKHPVTAGAQTHAGSSYTHFSLSPWGRDRTVEFPLRFFPNAQHLCHPFWPASTWLPPHITHFHFLIIWWKVGHVGSRNGCGFQSLPCRKSKKGFGDSQ